MSDEKKKNDDVKIITEEEFQKNGVPEGYEDGIPIVAPLSLDEFSSVIKKHSLTPHEILFLTVALMRMEDMPLFSNSGLLCMKAIVDILELVRDSAKSKEGLPKEALEMLKNFDPTNMKVN